MPARLTGNDYANFLRTDMSELLENVFLEQRQQMYFQHDGAPPHISLRACRVLNERYRNRWIGRGGPMHWPARSPDLTPMDFFMGYHQTIRISGTHRQSRGIRRTSYRSVRDRDAGDAA